MFYCEPCNYTTNRKASYEKHILTSKHHINVAKDAKVTPLMHSKSEPILHVCKYCEKCYASRSGLFKHEKKCDENPFKNSSSIPTETATIIESSSDPEIVAPTKKEEGFSDDTVMKLIDQNTELMKIIVETKTAPTTINNTTNNTVNTTNNFNLNMFLNEECKDAMNIMDFVASLKYKIEDLERIGRAGYVEGISNIMIEGLNNLEITQRPIHCTDVKRDSVYVKDNDEWQKDNSKDRIRRAIKHVANNNFKKLPEWQEKNPEHSDINTNKHKEYVKIINEVSGGGTDEEDDKNFKKIIKRVAAETAIDRNDPFV